MTEKDVDTWGDRVTALALAIALFLATVMVAEQTGVAEAAAIQVVGYEPTSPEHQPPSDIFCTTGPIDGWALTGHSWIVILCEPPVDYGNDQNVHSWAYLSPPYNTHIAWCICIYRIL